MGRSVFITRRCPGCAVRRLAVFANRELTRSRRHTPVSIHDSGVQENRLAAIVEGVLSVGTFRLEPDQPTFFAVLALYRRIGSMMTHPAICGCRSTG